MPSVCVLFSSSCMYLYTVLHILASPVMYVQNFTYKRKCMHIELYLNLGLLSMVFGSGGDLGSTLSPKADILSRSYDADHKIL